MTTGPGIFFRSSSICYFFFSFLSIFFSCKKGEDRLCFKSNGNVITEQRAGENFRFIYLHDDVNLILKQDSFFSISVECPENLVNFIRTDVESSFLTIKNLNKCDFLRSFKKEINVYVTLKELDEIYFTGSGKITSVNTIKSPKIIFNFWNASGSLDLDLEAGISTCNLHAGTGDFTLRGSSVTSAVYSLGYGFFRLENYKSVYSIINNSGTGDFFINVEKEMEVRIHSMGSVFYRGDPDNITSEIDGKGELIKL